VVLENGPQTTYMYLKQRVEQMAYTRDASNSV